MGLAGHQGNARPRRAKPRAVLVFAVMTLVVAGSAGVPERASAGTVLDQSQTHADGYDSTGGTARVQTFKPARNGPLDRIVLNLGWDADCPPNAPLAVDIFDWDDPVLTAVASAEVPFSAFPNAGFAPVTISFDPAPVLVAEEDYMISIAAPVAQECPDEEQGFRWLSGDGDPYPRGNGGLITGTSLLLFATRDMWFETYMTLPVFPLNVTSSGSGSGHVTSSPPGIDCGVSAPADHTGPIFPFIHPDCTEDFDEGTVVTLTAHNAPGSGFVGWSGDGCSGSAPTCEVTVNQARTVDAEFADVTPPDSVIDSGPADGSTINVGEATFEFHGEPEAGTAKVQCRHDGPAGPGSFADCSSGDTFSGLQPGSHTFSFRAEDQVGNQDPTPAQATISYKVIPTFSAGASDGGTVGSQLTDTATLSGGHAPTGEVEFELFGPGDPDCSSAPVFTDDVAVDGNREYTSDPFTSTEAGTYRWIARYSGDQHNEAAGEACNAPGQSVVVNEPPADPGPGKPGSEEPNPKNVPPVCRGQEATIVAEPGANTIGTDGNDVIVGTSGPDHIHSGAGDDVICGFGGDDTLNGGTGDDDVFGGEGDDALHGKKGADQLRGAGGDDVLGGGRGKDLLHGSAGDDQLKGRRGPDNLVGRGGNDELRGGGGDDDLKGNAGDDELHGNSGSDRLHGGSNSDSCDGGFGADQTPATGCETTVSIP